MKQALVIVDIQKDFCPGGSLPVAEGDMVVGPSNRLISMFEKKGYPVFFTRDWHPADHSSFKDNGGIWPPHCIAETEGASFHEGLNVPSHAVIISKATEKDSDAYSGFQGTDLSDRLKSLKVEGIIVTGLATDYCVKNTVLDGLKTGLAVSVVREAVRPVNVQPGDGDKAMEEMLKAGAGIVSVDGVSI